MSQHFTAAFTDNLRNLNTIEMQKIKLLRDVARENPSKASDVAQALEAHILTCSKDHKLPAVYLLDCMLKTAGPPYPEHLANVILRVFGPVWDGATPDLRTKLAKTAGTWKGLVPEQVMSAVLAKMQPPARMQAGLGWPQQQSLLFSGGAGPMLATTAPQFMLNAAGQPVLLSAVPGSMLAAPQLAPAVLPPGTAFGGVLLPGAPPVQAPFLQAAPGALSIAPGGQLHAALTSATAAAMASSLASSMAGLSAHLQGTQAASSATAPVQPGRSPLHAASEPPQDPVKAAVDALFAATAATKSKFLDLQFVRNRRLQTATHHVRHWYTSVDQWLEGTRPTQDTPSHFFDEQQADAAHEQGGKGALQVAMVEEDPSQPTCAISGEAFERTYDPGTDKWYYEDAVVLTGEQAAAYGVMEGSIVKVNCLAGALPVVAPTVAEAQAPASAAHKKGGTAAGVGDAQASGSTAAAAGVKRPHADNVSGVAQSAAGCAAGVHSAHAPEAKRIKAG